MADYAIHEATLTDIADTIRKKDGTQALIDPADYADRINLMGLLEEDTASGAIAHIIDGADRVPIKSWEVTLPASLDGVSSLNCYAYGKNLIDLSSLVFGYVKTNGTFETGHSNGEMRSGFIPVKPDTTYYFSIFETTGTAADWVGIGEYTTNDTSGFVRRDSYWRFTTGSTTKYIVVSARNLEQATKIQLEVGNDPTTWEAYQAPTTTTVSLGRTIYGGTADVVAGTGTETYGLQTFDGTEGTGGTPSWTMISVTQGTMFRITVSGKATTSATNTLCSYYTPTAQAQRADGTVSGAGTNVDIIDNRFSSVDAFKAWLAENPVTLVYELATSTDFTFTPITPTPQTALGVNNFWADEGDSSVVYRNMGTQTIITPTLISKSITANGIYSASSDNADGFSSVNVAVPVTPIISESDWNNMTDTEKRTYGLVVIQQASSGYKRGIYVNGADYPVLEEYSDILTTGLALDVIPDTSYIIECCFYASGYINDGHVMGTTTGNHRNFHVTTYNNMWYFEGDVGKADNQLYPVAGGMDITFRCEGTTAYMNGNNVGTIGRVDGGTSYALAQRGNAITGNNYKYKYFKIWDSNNNLLHDFRFMANKTMIDLVTLNTKTYS